MVRGSFTSQYEGRNIRKIDLKVGWSLLMAISPWGGLPLWQFHLRVVSHHGRFFPSQGGLSSGPFLLSVVLLNGSLQVVSSVSLQGGLSSWSLFSGWSHPHVGSSSWWSLLVEVSLQGGLSACWFLLRVVSPHGSF